VALSIFEAGICQHFLLAICTANPCALSQYHVEVQEDCMPGAAVVCQ